MKKQSKQARDRCRKIMNRELYFMLNQRIKMKIEKSILQVNKRTAKATTKKKRTE